MKMRLQLIIIFLFNIILINCNTINHDIVRRSPNNDDNIFTKAKTGLLSFSSGVKSVAVKGYEEVKNLFSKDRNVGDYVIDKIDVRFGEEEEEENSSIVTNSIQDVTENNERSKRDAANDESMKDSKEVVDFAMEEINDSETATQSECCLYESIFISIF
jgi:hypothetical protein